MLLERLFDDGLAQASYLVGCERSGLALIIDPNRDIDQYVRAAARRHMRIVAVTETHIHADFASGSRELARRTGARLLLSGAGDGDWQYRFAESDGACLVRHGDRFEVGTLAFEVLHTPGHTPEHICFAVTDTTAGDRPMGIFTGDFIFVGDVGRPDLLERAAHVAGTMDVLARRLFHSLAALQDRPDYLQLWPGHGAGSACGKALGAVPSSTLGYERIANWALRCTNEEDFVREVTHGQPEPPPYFARMKTINRDGPPELPTAPLPRLSLSAVRALAAAGAPVVDTRSSVDFAGGHLPGALHIPVGSSFATWAGWLLPADRDIVLLADDDARAANARRLVQLIGLDRVAGVGFADVRTEWTQSGGLLDTVPQIAPDALDGEVVADVRGAGEWAEGHLPGARHLFLGELLTRARDLPRDTPIAVMCESGTRASIAASLLQAHGFTRVGNLVGGYRGWRDAGRPVVTDI